MQTLLEKTNITQVSCLHENEDNLLENEDSALENEDFRLEKDGSDAATRRARETARETAARYRGRSVFRVCFAVFSGRILISYRGIPISDRKMADFIMLQASRRTKPARKRCGAGLSPKNDGLFGTKSIVKIHGFSKMDGLCTKE